MLHLFHNAACIHKGAASIGIDVKGISEVWLHELKHLHFIQTCLCLRVPRYE